MATYYAATSVLGTAVATALREGRDDDAAARLKWLELLPPVTAEEQFLKARLLRHRGDLDGMADALKAAVKLGFDTKMADREQMLALAQIGELEKVESPLNAWLMESDPDLREVCSAYANGLAATSRIPEAVRVLTAWQSDFPNDVRPVYRRGRILEHQRRKEDAYKLYSEAAESDPQYLPAVNNAARLLLENRKIKEAMAQFEEGRRKHPNPVFDIHIAECLRSLGELEQAKAILEKCVIIPIADLEKAYREVDELLETLAPAAELGKINADLSHFDEAEKWLTQALAYNDRDLESRYSYAVALRGQGKSQEAEREFERVRKTREALNGVNSLWDRIDTHPTDVEARLGLAKIFLEYESRKAGMFWLKSALELQPDNVEAQELMKKYAENNTSPSAGQQ
ncbi:MAG: tetratricopeptide repeat protein [Pirellulales bacterium]